MVILGISKRVGMPKVQIAIREAAGSKAVSLLGDNSPGSLR
jgi:hypothetical protein